MNRRAFSLIELMVVLLILAITAGAVALRFHTLLHGAEIKDIAGKIAEFDRLARVTARQNDRRLQMVVNLEHGTFRRKDERKGDKATVTLGLPSGYQIAKLLVGKQEIISGIATICYSRLGLTPSYAILLEHEDGTSQWILIVGLTGETTEMDDEEQIKEILVFTGARHHAG